MNQSTSMTVGRRQFLKTSAFTAAAFSILSQGKSLAQNGSSKSVTYLKKEFQYGMILLNYPVDATNAFLSQINTTIPRSANNAQVGELSLYVNAINYPAANLKLSSQERQDNIPHSKVFITTTFTQSAYLDYDEQVSTFLGINDRKLPATETGGTNGSDQYITDTAQVTLHKISNTTSPWVKGQSPSSDPQDPDYLIVNNNGSTQTDGVLGMAYKWNQFGWSWVGMLRSTTTITAGVEGYFSWSPGNSECKTQTLNLVWTLAKVKRWRLVESNQVGDYLPITTNESPVEGWSKWTEY